MRYKTNIASRRKPSSPSSSLKKSGTQVVSNDSFILPRLSSSGAIEMSSKYWSSNSRSRPSPSPASLRSRSDGSPVRWADQHTGIIAKVRRQFGPKHPAHPSDLQFLHQPGIAKQIVRVLNAAQQRVTVPWTSP
jgi:hypothetical protein